MNDFKVTITINGLERLAAAIEAFNASHSENTQPVPQQMPQAPVQQPMPQRAAPQQMPMQPIPQPVPVQAAPQQVPMQQIMPMQQAPTQMPLPTTAVAQEYTYDQLAVAASGLVNMGKQAKLMEILHAFGISAMTELSKERYGDFATALKQEGAVM